MGPMACPAFTLAQKTSFLRAILPKHKKTVLFCMGHVQKIQRRLFYRKTKTLREPPRPLKALKNNINIQFPGIQGSVDIFWLISDHLGNFIRQIQLKFGPDWIRGVPGLQKPAKKTRNLQRLAKKWVNRLKLFPGPNGHAPIALNLSTITELVCTSSYLMRPHLR